MISVLATYQKKFRAFGWVQDPSNFRSLCDVVAVFDENSEKHRELVETRIPMLIAKEDGRDEFIGALRKSPVRLSYSQLTGTSFSPRSRSRCNGIIQAAVKGQGREFIGDWPADNYVRWAHCLGFIKYNYPDDTFEITEEGLKLTAARECGEGLSGEERELLIYAVLSYPPAVRILKLLSEEDAHLTKFEIGQKLGFVGEDGFTNMPQKLLICSLEGADPKEKNSMRTDWEGSSDKYARMIAGWLEKLGLVKREPKEVKACVAGRSYTEKIGQAYRITAAGLTALNRAEGRSRHKRIAKNICWEMLATKGDAREYLRTRRAYILRFLAQSKNGVSVSDITDSLKESGIAESADTVTDDIEGLKNIGLDIQRVGDLYNLKDTIRDFIIPLPQSLEKPDLLAVKEELRAKLTHLPHEYLSLVDLAYDSKQNRLFEMKVIELLTEVCGFQGLHLGGARRPDGIVYTTGEVHNYGIIIDTKAYAKGYNLPILQAGAMERYIEENQKRDDRVNPNKWWENFGDDLEEYYYMFVSGHFTGNIQAQLERLSRNKGVKGAAVDIVNLLLCADSCKSGTFTQEDIRNRMFQNREFRFSLTDQASDPQA